jgi:flagellar assembly protein FliH
LSNLIKSVFVKSVGEEDEKHIIDSNELFEKRLEEKRQKEELRQLRYQSLAKSEESEDGFEGLNTDQLDRLTADQDMIGFNDGEAGTVSEEELAQANEQLARMQEEAEQIIADAQQQAEEIRQNAAQQGHDEGYQQGYQEGMNVAAVAEAQYRQQQKDLEEEYRKLVESVEPEMVDALTRIYEHVFSVRFQDDKGIILHLLSQTLSRTEPTGEFLVHVSSEDYELLLDSREELEGMIPGANCHLEVIEDTFLKSGECMLETDGGVFDCSLGTELSELRKKLKLLSWSGNVSA